MHSSVLISFLFLLTHCNRQEEKEAISPWRRNIDLHRHEYKINCPQAAVAPHPPRCDSIQLRTGHNKSKVLSI